MIGSYFDGKVHADRLEGPLLFQQTHTERSKKWAFICVSAYAVIGLPEV